ncbi:MAG: nodulation protein NfeD [Deltaproteobacteria bacterium]|nr:nodulation protein NfeD [Deltaproteobacteria bacterium]
MRHAPRQGARRTLYVALVGIALTVAREASARVNLIVIDGTINPAVDDFIRQSVAISAHDGAEALVIQLDTPGGLLTSTKRIVKELLGAPLPVIVYVAPAGASATSAGVFVTMAAHVAAMAPGTTIGAAHPVGAGGDNVGRDMRKKLENFTASFGKAIAERRGRNIAWAEKAVRESVTLTENEAVAKKVVDLVVPDLPALLAAASGREVQVGDHTVRLVLGGATEVVRLEMRLKDRVLDLIADPNVSYLLFMAGLLGLYVEISHPGLVLPGVVGGISLLLALAAFQVLPINSTGVLLLLFAAALVVAEAFMPSFGVLGVGGIVAFALGSLLLFDTPESTIAVDRTIVAAAILAVSGAMLAIGYLVTRAQRRPVATGAEGLVGEIGVVREVLTGGGKVFVHGEHWDVISDAALEPGERVEVLRVEPGLRLRVRRASPGRA